MPESPRRKYRNQPTEVDGHRFDSKREAARYVELQGLRKAGVVSWFTRQVPFHLPGKIRYVADFLVVYADGRTVVEDVKSAGTRTQVYINKRKQVLALFGVEVVEV
jgi:hypothetical protein